MSKTDKRKEFNRLGAFILHLEEGHQGKLKPIRVHIMEWCFSQTGAIGNDDKRNVFVRTFIIGVYQLFFKQGVI